MGDKNQKNLTTKDYERIGKTLESIFVEGSINHRQVYQVNFFRGLVFGIGSTLGATIVLAVIIWLLGLVDQVPFIGDFIDNVKETIETNQP